MNAVFRLSVVSARLRGAANSQADMSRPSAIERLLSVTELRSLTGESIRLRSHTITHPDVIRLVADKVREELEGSKRDLGRRIGQVVRSVSFLYSQYHESVLSAVCVAGYEWIYSIEVRDFCSTGKSRPIGRYRAPPAESLLQLKLRVAGAYDWRHFCVRVARLLQSGLVRSKRLAARHCKL